MAGRYIISNVFNIYTAGIHEITDESRDIEIIQFADDFMIVVADKNKRKLEEKANEVLMKFIEKIRELIFLVNEEKTKYMCTINHRFNPIKVDINGVDLKEENCIKYLGIYVDNKLKFNKHIKETVGHVMKRMNMLKIIAGSNKKSHPETMMNVYRALIRSRIDYGQVVYGNINNTMSNKLQSLANAAIRLVQGSTKSTPINSILTIAAEPRVVVRRRFMTRK